MLVAASMFTTPAPAMAAESAPQQVLTGTQPVSDNPSEIPAFLGGELHGLTTQTLSVDGYGDIVATIDNDSGEITGTYPDGSTKTITARAAAQALQARLSDATPEQTANLQASMQERVTKEQVCPYLVGLVGSGHAYAWGQVLAMAAVNPAIALLAALGEGAFWVWVSTHC
ncbi:MULTISPECIES: hypothetical protein [Corynebacterium]|uniref:hypothetical protein n=1 Tax=Corynebacterium TaxID=1716 RepID=UPI00124CC68A|nr:MULTISPECIES: hypothetical protein [Corynebacterium]